MFTGNECLSICRPNVQFAMWPLTMAPKVKGLLSGRHSKRHAECFSLTHRIWNLDEAPMVRHFTATLYPRQSEWLSKHKAHKQTVWFVTCSRECCVPRESASRLPKWSTSTAESHKWHFVKFRKVADFWIFICGFQLWLSFMAFSLSSVFMIACACPSAGREKERVVNSVFNLPAEINRISK